MLDIDPEEVNGLQEYVSNLKSIINRHKLTIKDNPQNEFEWTLDECIKRSRSFQAFCFAVHPDYLEKLLPICLELDYFLNEESGEEYLSFNIEKHGKSIIYKKLGIIWNECFCYYTDSKWYYSFIAQITNLTDNSESVRKGIERSR